MSFEKNSQEYKKCYADAISLLHNPLMQKYALKSIIIAFSPTNGAENEIIGNLALEYIESDAEMNFKGMISHLLLFSSEAQFLKRYA